MSTTVDSKVVEMQFDNDQFEKGVSESLSSLEKLKQALQLDDAASGFDSIDKAANSVSLDSISSSLETLEERFSTLGIVGMTVISELTSALLNTLGSAISSVASSIVSGGITRAMNLENAQFMLQGLLDTEEEVEAVMQNVNDAVDGTAYSLDAAANVASQLVASGMEAGDEMESALRAVAGVAAMTNSEYSDIGDIFTTVAGNGKLMTEQLRQLSSRGLNAAATLADYLGETEATVREMVSDGEIDFQTFAAAMDDAFGEHAKDANTTFSGAMSNISAALSRVGALFVSPLIEQNGTLVTLLNAVREKINAAKEVAEEFADVFVEVVTNASDALTEWVGGLSFDTLKDALSDPWDTLEEKITDTGIELEDFEEAITEVAESHGIALSDMIESAGSFQATLSEGWLTTEMFVEAIDKLCGNVEETTTVTEEAVSTMEDYADVVTAVVRGDYGNGADRIEALTEAGYDYATVQELINQCWVDGVLDLSSLSESVTELSEAELVSAGYTEEQIEALKALAEEAEESGSSIEELIALIEKPSGKKLLLNTIMNTLKSIVKVLSTVKSAWSNVFKSIDSTGIYSILESLESMSDWLYNVATGSENLDKLQRTLEGVFSVMKLFVDLVTESFVAAVNLIFPAATSASGGILDLTANIGDMVVAFREWVEENSVISKTLTKITNVISSVASGVVSLVNKFLQLEIVQTVIEALSDAFEKLMDILEPVITVLTEDLADDSKSLIDVFADVGTALVESLESNIDIAADSLPGKAYQIVSEFADSIYSAIGVETDSLFDAFYQIADNIVSGLKNGLGDKVSIVVEAILEIGQTIIDKICNLLGIHSPSTVLYEIGTNIVKGLSNGISDGVDGVVGLFSGIVSGIKQAFSNVDWGSVFGIAAMVGLIAVIKSLAGAFETLVSPIKALSSVFSSAAGLLKQCKESIKNTFKALNQVLTAFSVDLYAGAVLVLAIAIIALSAAVAIISNISIADLAKAVIAIAALAAIIGALSYVLSLVAKNMKGIQTVKFAGLSASIVSLGVTLLLMAAVIKIIGGMDESAAEQGINGILTLLASLTLVMISFGILSQASSTGMSDIAKVGTMMLLISASLLIMAATIAILGNLKASVIEQGITAIGSFVVLIGALVYATKFSGSDLSSVGTMILKVSLAMAIMAVVVKVIGSMEWSALIKGIIGIASFSAFIIALIVVTKYIQKEADLATLGSTILAMSAAIAILVVSAKLIASMTWGELLKAAVGMAGFVAIIAVLVLITNLAPKEQIAKISATLIAMTVSIALLAAIAIILGQINLASLEKGVLVVAELAVIMAMLIYVTKYATSCQKTIIALSVSIAVMAASVLVLSLIDGSKLAGATLALTVLMGMFAVIELASSKVTNAYATLIIMAVIIALLAAAIYAVAQLPAENVLVSAIALSELMIVLAAVMVVIGSIKSPSLTASIAIVALTLVLDLIAVMLVCLVNAVDDPTKYLVIADALTEIMIALSAALIVCAAVGTLGTSAYVGIGAMATAIAALTAIFIALGELCTQIDGMEEVIDLGIQVLTKIATGLGEAISGFAEGLTSSLPQIGTNIGEFMTNLQPFFDGLDQVSPDTVSAVGNLAAALTELTVSGVIDTVLTSIFGGSDGSVFTTLGTNLKAFGQAVVDYANVINDSGLDASTVLMSALAGQALVELYNNLPKDNIFTNLFGSDVDMDSFSEQLSGFGSAIAAFGDSLGEGVDAELISDAAIAGSALGELANSMPTTGGLKGWFFGETVDMSVLGEQLEGFGASMIAFQGSVSGIDQDVIESGSTAGEALAEMAKSLPTTGGKLKEWFFGETLDMETFGDQLEAFGEAMVTFGDTIGSDDSLVSAVETGAAAGTALAEMVDSLPKSGGIVDSILGSTDMEDLSNNLPAFGTAISEFATNISGDDLESKIETGVDCGKALADLADSLPSSGGLFDIFSGTTVSMSDFATELTNFATAMSGFATEVDGIEEGSIQTGVNAGMALASLYEAIPDSSFFDIFTGGNMGSFSTGIGQFGSGLSSFASSISSISDFSALYSSATAGSRLALMAETIPSDAKSLLSNFADGIEAFGEGLDSFFANVEGADIASASSAIKNLVANVLAAVEGQEDSFSQAGANLVNKLISGIQSQQNSVGVSFNSVISQSISSINSKQTSFKSSGVALMSQFILGLENKTSSVQSKIVSMLNKATVTINSKKSTFKTAGADLISYLCRGIESKTSSVKSSSGSLGTAGANAVREKYSAFYSTGAYLVTGFCNGITANTYKAKAKAKAMATAAAQAAADALDESSPSKVGYEIGDYFGIGFVNGIENEVEAAYSAGSEIASTATSALSSAIEKISDYVSNGIDSDLTITPVLDLSNVESGAAAISGMFSSPSIGVMSNLSAISAADNARIQNGNSNDDVVNAINKMRKEMSSMGSTSNYNINGVTYDDGSNVSDAVKSIVRAARVERRI